MSDMDENPYESPKEIGYEPPRPPWFRIEVPPDDLRFFDSTFPDRLWAMRWRLLALACIFVAIGAFAFVYQLVTGERFGAHRP
jgi:hypothetical protein